MKVTTSNKLVKQKKVERVGLDGTAGQGFESRSGNPSNSLNYGTKRGEQYHILVTTGKAKTNAVRMSGKSNDANATVMADRAKRLQAKPEKVRDAKPVVGAARECAKQQVGSQWGNFTDNELARKAKEGK
jgi:hypothetical protein